ncbi:MAG TPA: aminoglycoside phosphotransferase [Methylophaga aminisulfidivorans]|uniref:Aminoglycoside phosphotransferase n=2 Tax=root TaxID=1 RepID=A0A7C1W607_9GAMM|nr:aminoglycoside phosphotransferase [Methylophaga sp.]HEC73398.1 aminoglycoside phosphotransferase [Methylophaga aminisulfidivorans]
MQDVIEIDTRIATMKSWLKNTLESDNFELSIASSDASFRRYFRIHYKTQSFIVMDAPPEHEDISSFISIAEFLASQGVNVPVIHAKDITQGFLLLTDFGSTSFLSAVSIDTANSLYKLAIDELLTMQCATQNQVALPIYDDKKLFDEMSLFSSWFLEKHLGLTSPVCVNESIDFILSETRQQPHYFVHRDYHSRNLMVCEDKLGIIDFQDAVIGPVSYDLVSLLKDCYIKWPVERVDEWKNYYKSRAISLDLLSENDERQFDRWFDIMGLQRHLKVLGIFCRLHYRDGKSNYLNDLPLTLHYVLQATKRYEELEPLHHFLINTKEVMAIQ